MLIRSDPLKYTGLVQLILPKNKETPLYNAVAEKV